MTKIVSIILFLSFFCGIQAMSKNEPEQETFFFSYDNDNHLTFNKVSTKNGIRIHHLWTNAIESLWVYKTLQSKGMTAEQITSNVDVVCITCHKQDNFAYELDLDTKDAIFHRQPRCSPIENVAHVDIFGQKNSFASYNSAGQLTLNNLRGSTHNLWTQVDTK